MSDMHDGLADILSKILLIEKNDISEDLTRKGIEQWDSMTHLVLISEIEQEFDITFSDEEIAEIQSVKDIESILKKHNKL